MDQDLSVLPILKGRQNYKSWAKVISSYFKCQDIDVWYIMNGSTIANLSAVELDQKNAHAMMVLTTRVSEHILETLTSFKTGAAMWVYLKNVFDQQETLEETFARILKLLDDDDISITDFIQCYLGHVKVLDTLSPDLVPRRVKIKTFLTALERRLPDFAVEVTQLWLGTPEDADKFFETMELDAFVADTLGWMAKTGQ